MLWLWLLWCKVKFQKFTRKWVSDFIKLSLKPVCKLNPHIQININRDCLVGILDQPANSNLRSHKRVKQLKPIRSYHAIVRGKTTPQFAPTFFKWLISCFICTANNISCLIFRWENGVHRSVPEMTKYSLALPICNSLLPVFTCCIVTATLLITLKVKQMKMRGSIKRLVKFFWYPIRENHRAGLDRGVPMGRSTQIVGGRFEQRLNSEATILNYTHCSALAPVQKEWGKKQDGNLLFLYNASWLAWQVLLLYSDKAQWRKQYCTYMYSQQQVFKHSVSTLLFPAQS